MSISLKGMFHIVDFKNGKERTVVPDIWLSINDTSCVLPPDATNDDLEVLVRYRTEPVEGWLIHDVSLVETFETYLEAKKQLEKSREKLQLDTSTQRKRKKPSFLEDYSTQDSDNDQESNSTFTSFDIEDFSEDEWIPSPEFIPREKISSFKKLFYKDNKRRSLQFSRTQLLSEKEAERKRVSMSSCHVPILPVLHSMQKQLSRNTQSVQLLLEQQKYSQSPSKRSLPNKPVRETISKEMDILLDDSNSAQSDSENQNTYSAEDRCIKKEKSPNSEITQSTTYRREESTSSNETFQQQIFKMFEELKKGQEEIKRILAGITNAPTSIGLPQDCPTLPVDSHEALLAYDKYLDDKLSFSQICAYYGIKGGFNYSSTVRRILQMILTNNLAQQYNWKGTGGVKLAFCQFKNIFRLITTSIRQHVSFEKVTDQEIEGAIKKWLVHSKDREGGRSLRAKE